MRFLKPAFLLLFILSCIPVLLFASNTDKSVYGLYSETYEGMKLDVYNSTNTGVYNDPDGGFLGAWYYVSSMFVNEGGSYYCNWASSNICFDVTIATEGKKCIRTMLYEIQYSTPAIAARDAFIWFQFGYNPEVPKTEPTSICTDMSAYEGGTLDFMIKTATEVEVCVFSGKVSTHPWANNIFWLSDVHTEFPSVKLYEQGYITRLSQKLWTLDKYQRRELMGDNDWQHVSIPLSVFSNAKYPLDLTKISVPASFSYHWRNSYGTFWIDNVVWKKPDPPGSVTLTLKNISDNEPTDQITWSDVGLGTASWKTADQYLEVKLDYHHQFWGLQIYTDNTDADANPRFIPVAGSTENPAGLLGYDPLKESTATVKIPMCWRITDSTITTSLDINQLDEDIGGGIFKSTLFSYEVNYGTGYPCFVWMKDEATPNIVNQNTTEFVNGEDYVIAWDTRGIQHAEGTWGGCKSPNYIYFGACFANATTPRTYKTNKLMLELFHE